MLFSHTLSLILKFSWLARQNITKPLWLFWSRYQLPKYVYFIKISWHKKPCHLRKDKCSFFKKMENCQLWQFFYKNWHGQLLFFLRIPMQLILKSHCEFFHDFLEKKFDVKTTLKRTVLIAKVQSLYVLCKSHSHKREV